LYRFYVVYNKFNVFFRYRRLFIVLVGFYNFYEAFNAGLGYGGVTIILLRVVYYAVFLAVYRNGGFGKVSDTGFGLLPLQAPKVTRAMAEINNAVRFMIGYFIFRNNYPFTLCDYQAQLRCSVHATNIKT
jgi:hypothetical protein